MFAQNVIISCTTTTSTTTSSSTTSSTTTTTTTTTYGKKAWNHGLTKNMDERVARQANYGKDNGMYGKRQNTFGGKRHTKEARRKISEAHKGKKYDYHNRAIRSIYGKEGFLDCNYRRYLPKDKDSIECEVCGTLTKIGGKDGIYVHHKDKVRNPRNNSRKNLQFVCPKCHNILLHPEASMKNLKKGWRILHGNRKD